ncbi:MAG: ABC transporter ATP-binding protein, partial [Myxococcaceae bacterium]|nr:ABC transporter ATP-binding protein [Myxococcaceae bacterium]
MASGADDAIVLRGVTKRFKRSTVRKEHTTFKSELVAFLTAKRRKAPPELFIETLRGVDLTIPRGRTVGILGRNGSGKSTLLKLITGIYAPTTGSIEVNGRISALLDLGAGFHPDFTGRENILINGIILGMSRAEVKARMDDIIAFSELGDFIDEPVRTYSSGMYMRLAFSVATHVDPEILIIDEILAVGDAHFSRKSMAKMEEFKRAGKTIVLVTHDLSVVERWCDM